MNTRTVIGSVLASVGVLVVGWQAGTVAGGASTVVSTASGTTGSASSALTNGATSTGTTSSATTTGSTSGFADGVYTGTDVNTRFGSVQVQVTVSGGQITDVTALQLTDHDGKSVQISNRAAPVLASEVIAAQSADVSNVTGATYTTRAYLSSVQSALDQAAG